MERLREQIDSADRRILSALAKRADLVRAIGRYKLANNIKAFDSRRKNYLKRTWIKEGKSIGLPAKLVGEIFEKIHDYSVSVEKKVR